MIKIAKMGVLPTNRIKYVKGNRDVDLNHKENFKKRIQEKGFADTIKVAQKGDDYYAVEGQHRLRALFELGITEVPCTIVDWVDVDNFDEIQSFIVSMNDNNKKWALPDYIKSFSDKNVLEYVYLKKQIAKYSKFLSVGVITTIYDGIIRTHTPLRQGRLKFINKKFSDILVDDMHAMVKQWGKKKLPAQVLRNATCRIMATDDPMGYLRAFKLAATNLLSLNKDPMPDGDDSFKFWFEHTVEQTYKTINNK